MALRDVPVQADERLPEAALGPEAGSEQVGDAPVGDHDVVAPLPSPGERGFGERDPNARATNCWIRGRPAEQGGALRPGEAGVDAGPLDGDELERADDAAVALDDELADLRLGQVLEDLVA